MAGVSIILVSAAKGSPGGLEGLRSAGGVKLLIRIELQGFALSTGKRPQVIDNALTHSLPYPFLSPPLYI